MVKMYGELGLARCKATGWLSKEHLTVEYAMSHSRTMPSTPNPTRNTYALSWNLAALKRGSVHPNWRDGSKERSRGIWSNGSLMMRLAGENKLLENVFSKSFSFLSPPGWAMRDNHLNPNGRASVK